MNKIIITFLAALITTASLFGGVIPEQQSISLQRGDSIRVECPVALQPVTVDGNFLVAYCPPNIITTATNTSTSTETKTATVVSTRTRIPSRTPSKTPTPVVTLTPVATTSSLPISMQSWHAPAAHDGMNVHEHGDKPPQWADDWSNKNFGHPVMFGGDEMSSPMEQSMKHQAYKGFLANLNGVDLYIRYHAASNPADRSSAFHSYEVYARDASGNISFWQGLYWSGYPEFKTQRMTRTDEEPTATNAGRDQFIIGSPDVSDWNKFLRCEQWYTTGGLWSWDIAITICGATTYFNYGEYLNDPMNPSTWKPTGDLGLSRRLEVTHYGVTNPNITGEKVPVNQWYCVSKFPKEDKVEGADHRPEWDITGAVASPNACPSGYLPQWFSSTFPSDGIYFKTGNTAEKTFPSGNNTVTIPN